MDNKKIAKKLVGEAMEYLRANGIDLVQLEVWSANRRAYVFYKNLGFTFRETEKYSGIYL
ncbi:MAG: GNAT family N-acetyltransferase [Bacillaceae bacterium]|nr:GNAT family N-acetyltransferase [Bacillaceae bacterium]